MILEILSSAVMGSIVGYGYLKQNGATNDAAKMQRIFRNCGLVVKENGKDGKVTREVQLYRRKKEEWGTEYIYRIPLGLSFSDFEKKIDHIKDGLNNKKAVINVDFEDIKNLNFKENIPGQLKTLLDKKKTLSKEIEMYYDGMLRIKVYNQPMNDYLEYEEMKRKGWKIPIGVDRVGRIIYHDFDSEYYLLVAGAVGGGKSNALNLISSHLLFTQGENVRFSMVDLKAGIEFGCYENCKQVVGYAEHPEQVSGVLEKILTEIQTVRDKLKAKGFRNVIEAGIKERHFLIIDEIAELSPDEETDKELKALKQEIWSTINQIARLGRAWGIRIVSATQHPIQECIPKYLKRNSEGRLCFSVEDDVASRVVLGTTGAESLPEINGRALYKKGAKTTEVQTYRILNETIDKAIKPNIVVKRVRAENEPVNKESKGRSSTLVLEETGLS